MVKRLVVAALTIGCLAAQGAGIQADHIVTHVDGDRERVEAGRWIQDQEGRTRHDIDDWTQIVDPIEGVVWSANSKRGRYSEARRKVATPPMGTPLIDLPGAFTGPNAREISRTDLGIQEINGVECRGTLVEIAVSGGGFTKRIELEAWMTEAFLFPFNVVFATRSDSDEQRTELRNIVELTDAQMEGIFRPDDDWKESRFQIVRTNVGWSGLWPFTKPGTKVTGTIWPGPKPRDRDW